MIVDGRSVTPPMGASVLEVAAALGTTIPTLCHHPGLPPDGSCRMCLVEVDGRPGLHPACVLPAADELIVRTDTDADPGSAAVDAGSSPQEVPSRHRSRRQRASWRWQSATASILRPSPLDPVAAVDESNPFIRVDRNACIHCWRCVRACDRLNGVSAIGVFGRGDEAHIGFGADGPMQDSTCEFCGMCEAVCPTDALTLRGGVTSAMVASAASSVSTLCSYCGVGCRLNHHTADGRIVFTSPDWRAPANHGLLCVKGRFGWTYVAPRDRLTRPLVRRSLLGGRGDDLVETDWDTRARSGRANARGDPRERRRRRPRVPRLGEVQQRGELSLPEAGPAAASPPTTWTTAPGCVTHRR